MPATGFRAETLTLPISLPQAVPTTEKEVFFCDGETYDEQCYIGCNWLDGILETRKEGGDERRAFPIVSN